MVMYKISLELEYEDEFEAEDIAGQIERITGEEVDVYESEEE